MNVAEAKQLIGTMPPVEKAILRDKLADHKAVARFLGKSYNRELCQVVEALLDGKQVTVRRRSKPAAERNGKCLSVKM